MDAKEFFEDMREKVRKFERTQERYAEMISTDIGAIKYDDAPGGGCDPMARIDAAMDYLQIVMERSKALRSDLDYATSILYGESGNGGLAKLKKHNCEQTYQVNADAIAMHYLQGMSWKAIARDSEIYSDKEIRNFAMSGFRAIDKYGFAYLREGRNSE